MHDAEDDECLVLYPIEEQVNPESSDQLNGTNTVKTFATKAPHDSQVRLHNQL